MFSTAGYYRKGDLNFQALPIIKLPLKRGVVMEQETMFLNAGIYADYLDARGQKQQISTEIKTHLYHAFNDFTESHYQHLAPVFVYSEHQPLVLPLKGKSGLQGEWHLTLENGDHFQGKIIHNVLALPSHLPMGYHDLTLTVGEITEKGRLIIAPNRCYQPSIIQEGKKIWGTFLQLYTLKSERNWGIGDFGDLKAFIDHFAPLGADFIGLNPLHNLFPNNPEGASPYSPSSRLTLNYLYIAVDQLSEWETVEKGFMTASVRRELTSLRASDWLDYTAVAHLKMAALKQCFDALKNTPERFQKWQNFVESRGRPLFLQATFDALLEIHHKKSPSYGWKDFEKVFQNPESVEVKNFQNQHQDLIHFYTYLQFCSEEQLKECQALCDKHHMQIGLYRDLAVGATPYGGETWQNQSLFALKASIGAPPDILAPQGQNWGLAPMNPHQLKQQGYQPFIDLLRTNMNHCGALRMDHVLGLLRLWWIPEGNNASGGAYVSYPVDDLLSILALESHRHQQMVIGEDLGVVPEEIVQKLQKKGVFSYKIFYFEFDEYGSRHLDYFPKQAMTTLSTHDLPTLKGFWQEKDLELGRELNLYPSIEVADQLQKDRAEAKQQILQKMQYFGETLPMTEEYLLQNELTLDFNHQLQTYVAGCSSQLFGFQVEDWLNMLMPVNIPGTTEDYPNWRRKLSHTVAEIFDNPQVIKLLQAVHQRRQK